MSFNVNVIGSKPTPTPTPTPTPPQAVGAAGAGSRKGTTSYTVTFNAALNTGSADNPGLYTVLGGVKKRKKTVYTKRLGISSVSSSGNTVTIHLAKPFKGHAQVTVSAGILGSSGGSSTGNVSFIV